VPLLLIQFCIIIATVLILFAFFIFFVFKINKYTDWYERVRNYFCNLLCNIFCWCLLRSDDVAVKYPTNKLKFIRHLGKGEFGKVFLAEAPDLLNYIDTRYASLFDQSEGQHCMVAVKSCSQSENMSRDMLEADSLSSLRHPSVVKLLAVAKKPTVMSRIFRRRRSNDSMDVSNFKPPFLMFEFCVSGDLCAYLRKHLHQSASSKSEQSGVSMMTRLKFCLQISEGMAYLHRNCILHRDLAARNCLVTASGDVKISDFGLSRDIGESQTNSYTTRGIDALPVRWMAPESFTDGIYTTSSDVWSFGVVMWEIFTNGVQPYFGISNQQVISAVLQGKLLSKPRLSPEWIYEVMLLCWNFEDKYRPTFSDLLDFFTNIMNK